MKKTFSVNLNDNKPFDRPPIPHLFFFAAAFAISNNSPLPPLPSLSALCKYGSDAEEVGEGSDDWRLGTIFPQYFLGGRKKIFPRWNSLITGRGGGRRTPAPLSAKIVWVPTKFGNFCAARTDTNKFSICQLSSDNEKWGQRGFKIVTVSSQQIGGGAVRLNMENKAFTSPRFLGSNVKPRHT